MPNTCPHWTASIEKYGYTSEKMTGDLVCANCTEGSRSFTRKPSKPSRFHKVPCRDCQRQIWRIKTSKEGVCERCVRKRRKTNPRKGYNTLCLYGCGKKRESKSAFCSPRCLRLCHDRDAENKVRILNSVNQGYN